MGFGAGSGSDKVLCPFRGLRKGIDGFWSTWAGYGVDAGEEALQGVSLIYLPLSPVSLC